MRISVIGAGALGTFYAAMLAASGQDVTLVCRERDADALRKGISVTGAVEITARPSISTVPPPAAMTFITVKAYDVISAVKTIPPKPATPVILIHNGLGVDEEAAAILGKGRAGIGVSYSGVTFLEPGKVRLAGYTETVLGSAEDKVREMIIPAKEALEAAGLKARIVADIRAAQWEKLYANIAINPITALTGLHNGMLLEVPELKALAADTVDEAAKVAKALGVKTSGDPVENTYRVIRDTYSNRSSMLQDVARGRRTEIEALNGTVGRLGRQAGIPTPCNDALTALVKGMEKRMGIL
jgi:2-dehydropantoate 2-reductase